MLQLERHRIFWVEASKPPALESSTGKPWQDPVLRCLLISPSSPPPVLWAGDPSVGVCSVVAPGCRFFIHRCWLFCGHLWLEWVQWEGFLFEVTTFKNIMMVDDQPEKDEKDDEIHLDPPCQGPAVNAMSPHCTAHLIIVNYCEYHHHQTIAIIHSQNFTTHPLCLLCSSHLKERLIGLKRIWSFISQRFLIVSQYCWKALPCYWVQHRICSDSTGTGTNLAAHQIRQITWDSQFCMFWENSVWYWASHSHIPLGLEDPEDVRGKLGKEF